MLRHLVEHLSGSQCLNPRRRQFDGKWDSLQPVAQFGDRGRVLIRDLKAGATALPDR